MTTESLLSPGVVVSGGQITRSVLSPAAFVGSGAEVTDSVLMNGVRVGAGAIVRNAIIDKNVGHPARRAGRRGRGRRPGARVRGRGRAHGAGQGPAVPGVRRDSFTAWAVKLMLMSRSFTT